MQDQPHPRRLTRSAERRLGGVCGGIAEYFGIDATLVRIGFVLLALFSMGFGALLVYGLLWAIMPAPDADAPVRGAASAGNGALLLGIVLVLLGVSMAFRGLGMFWWLNWGIMRFGWSVALIAAGMLIVFVARRR